MYFRPFPWLITLSGGGGHLPTNWDWSWKSLGELWLREGSSYQVRTPLKRSHWTWMVVHPWKLTWHWKILCSIGSTSSNSGFSTIMLVFWGVILVSFWDGKFSGAILNFRWVAGAGHEEQSWATKIAIFPSKGSQLLGGGSHQPVRGFSMKNWQQKAKGLVLEWLLTSH